MIARLLSLATGRRVLVALVFLGIGGTVLFRLGPYARLRAFARPYPLPEETTTAQLELSSFLRHLGQAGRDLYAEFQWWDMLNPLLITVAGTLLMAWLIKHAGHQRRIWRFALFLPGIAGTADLVENFLLRAAIVAFPSVRGSGGLLANITKAKLLGLMVMVPIAIGLGAVVLTRSVRARFRAGALLLALVTMACGGSSPEIAGQWIGDLRRGEVSQRLEVSVDSSGQTIRVHLAASGLSNAPARQVPIGPDSLAVTASAGTDTVQLHGAADNGVWSGRARHGADTGSFELRRIHPITGAEWASIIGTYRTSQGGLLGIAPFSEFGSLPLIVDYSSGRIGPLYAIARNRFLVGHSLINPVFPADTLEVTFGASGAVRELRFSERGHAPIMAERVATRDEEVQFVNGPVTLSGTLTLPDGPGPHPALVLVHGSNAVTRDGFGPWSRYFAGLGYAVLAYDKRGTGTSTGDWKQADFAVLGTDVLAGVRSLAARPDIRADRIGLWGASQAGWVMPLVAAQAPAEIACLIVHAGSGTTVRQEGVLYIRQELRFAGLPEASVAIGMRYQELDDAVSQSGVGFDRLLAYYEQHSKVETWLWPPRPADDWFRPYYRMLMDFDPVPSWRRVSAPVLLFFGELDANVPPRESWPPIEQALRQAGNARVTQIVLPKANHLFLEAGTGGRDEYPALNRFVSGYFAKMAEWLNQVAR